MSDFPSMATQSAIPIDQASGAQISAFISGIHAFTVSKLIILSEIKEHLIKLSRWLIDLDVKAETQKESSQRYWA